MTVQNTLEFHENEHISAVRTIQMPTASDLECSRRTLFDRRAPYISILRNFDNFEKTTPRCELARSQAARAAGRPDGRPARSRTRAGCSTPRSASSNPFFFWWNPIVHHSTPEIHQICQILRSRKFHIMKKLESQNVAKVTRL